MSNKTIDNLSNLNAAPDTTDYVPLWDTSASATKKNSIANLLTSAAKPTQRNNFVVAQGSLATKNSVASGAATNIASIAIGGAGSFMSAMLVAIESSGAAQSSAGLWLLTNGYSTATVVELGKTLFGHSALSLTASINIGTRTITLSVTQTNAATNTNTVRISILPLVACVDETLTVASL